MCMCASAPRVLLLEPLRWFQYLSHIYVHICKCACVRDTNTCTHDNIYIRDNISTTYINVCTAFQCQYIYTRQYICTRQYIYVRHIYLYTRRHTYTPQYMYEIYMSYISVRHRPRSFLQAGFRPLCPPFVYFVPLSRTKPAFWISTRTAPGPISQVHSGCRVRHPQYSKKLFVRYCRDNIYVYDISVVHKCTACMSLI